MTKRTFTLTKKHDFGTEDVRCNVSKSNFFQIGY